MASRAPPKCQHRTAPADSPADALGSPEAAAQPELWALQPGRGHVSMPPPPKGFLQACLPHRQLLAQRGVRSPASGRPERASATSCCGEASRPRQRSPLQGKALHSEGLGCQSGGHGPLPPLICSRNIPATAAAPTENERRSVCSHATRSDKAVSPGSQLLLPTRCASLARDGPSNGWGGWTFSGQLSRRNLSSQAWPRHL